MQKYNLLEGICLIFKSVLEKIIKYKTSEARFWGSLKINC